MRGRAPPTTPRLGTHFCLLDWTRERCSTGGGAFAPEHKRASGMFVVLEGGGSLAGPPSMTIQVLFLHICVVELPHGSIGERQGPLQKSSGNKIYLLFYCGSYARCHKRTTF